jgi:excisionase family DNA binding protein
MLLTTRQAAAKLGISDKRVRQLIYEGRVKAIKVGNYNLIAEEDCHYERKRRGAQRREHRGIP